jgi:hypothetical protein
MGKKETAMPSAQRLEAATTMLTFWHTHYWDSAKLLAQGWAFYLSIVAAMVGFVVSHALRPHIATGLIRAAIIITAMHLVGSTLWGWGTMKLVGTVEALNRELDPSLFQDLALQRPFFRWKVIQALVMCVSTLISVVILIGLCLLVAQ